MPHCLPARMLVCFNGSLRRCRAAAMCRNYCLQFACGPPFPTTCLQLIDLMSGNNLLSVTLSIMQPTTELIANPFF